VLVHGLGSSLGNWDCLPGGFWTERQTKVFGVSIKTSVALVRRIQPLLPTLTANPVTRAALLAQGDGAADLRSTG